MRPSKLTIGLLLVIVVGVGGTYGVVLLNSDPGADDEVATLGTATVVYEGTVEANVSETLEIVAELRGYEPPTPARVSIEPFTSNVRAPRRFQVLGMEWAPDPTRLAFRWRIAGNSDSVVELTNDLSPEVQAVALGGAAERIHQERRGFSITDPTLDRKRFFDYDAAWAAKLIQDGAATYVEEAMWERLDRPGERPLTFYQTVAKRSARAHRATAAHRLGYLWVDSRIENPTELDAVYENPPNRTAALLHPNQSRTYPTMRLQSVEDAWVEDQRFRLGELLTRFVLETELSHDRASEAANGWVDDRLIEYLDEDNQQGFAWVVRLRSESQADEFRSALGAYLDGRGESVGENRWADDQRSYGIQRPDTRTVVLLLGPDSFIEATEVSIQGNVTIST